jgi:RNA polymerase sigma-32 factor
VKKSPQDRQYKTISKGKVEVLPKEDSPKEAEVLPRERPAEELFDTIEVNPAASTGAVSTADPLRQYMEEVKRHPLLEPEEEFRLAIKLKDEGDLNAARRLVTANLRLVVKIAMEYRSYYSNLLDLIQEGNIGLMKAVSKFDPTKGARLGYYSSWWIRSYILKYLLDNFRLVKIGTTQAQKKLFYHLMREKERLEAQGLLAGPKLLAERLNVREKDVVEMEQRLSGRGAELSLDAPVNSSGDEGGETSHMSLLADERELADDAMGRQQLLDLLKEKLPELEKELNEREKQILNDRLLAEEPKTLQEVASRYGLTRERARQIEAKVIAKLRKLMGKALS